MKAKLAVILAVVFCLSCAGAISLKGSDNVIQNDELYGLVKITDVDPDIAIDLRYATDDNFLHRKVYPENVAFILESVGRRLKRVNDRIKAQGLRLKIWDAYRPLWVQKEMWAILPDENFVADPAKGSRHNRGCAVDVTLIDAQGNELEMPTPFDDFTEKAHPDYMDLSVAAIQNRKILRDAMTGEGFLQFPTEWWHYDDPDWENHPVLDVNPYQTRVKNPLAY